jgi:hypothetical protein
VAATSWRRRPKILVLLGFGGLAVLAAASELSRSGPVLFSVIEPGDDYGQPTASLFNPLRDTGAERKTEGILGDLRAKKFELAHRELGSASTPEDFLQREASFPLRHWYLVNRVDRSNTSDLVYRVSRSDEILPVDPLFIELTRTDGRWQVLRLDTAY